MITKQTPRNEIEEFQRVLNNNMKESPEFDRGSGDRNEDKCPQPHLLCSAFGMFGSQMKGHQSLVRPLPSADIAGHRASYTWALLGLCLQSGPQRGGGERERERGNHSGHQKEQRGEKMDEHIWDFAEDPRVRMFPYQQDDSFKDEFGVYAHVQELKA